MMVAACRYEGCLRPIALHQLEAEDTAIEGSCPIEVGYLQVHMADPDAGIDRALRQVRFCQC